MDLGAFTADLASSFRSAMELNNITYTIDCEPLPSKDHLIYTDRDFWEKVVFNLIGNSFKVRLSHSHKGVGMSRKLTTYAGPISQYTLSGVRSASVFTSLVRNLTCFTLCFSPSPSAPNTVRTVLLSRFKTPGWVSRRRSRTWFLSGSTEWRALRGVTKELVSLLAATFRFPV
jgi:hypothetical protein